jgi:hypothetical protein
LSAIFRACPNLKLLDPPDWYRSLVTDISEIGCCPLAELTSLNISGCNVTDISAIGRGCRKLQQLNLNGCKVTDISAIGRCPELESLDITNSSVTDLTEIGRGCSKLASLSIGSGPEQLVKILRSGSLIAKVLRSGSLSSKPLQLVQSLNFECVGAHVSFVLRARASLGATTRSHAPCARSLWSQALWRKADARDPQRDHRRLSEHHDAQPRVRRRCVSLDIATRFSYMLACSLPWPSQVLQKADARINRYNRARLPGP